ncbi:phosphoenolpyruvate carboxylase [Pseudomonas aeruginosa]|nr:phosphoenolpyruvate carboxylase [Pseudomonas aeruginosa]
MRVVPLFETLDDLDNAGPCMERLLTLPGYRSRSGVQEVMIGYSDSPRTPVLSRRPGRSTGRRRN